MAKKKEADKKVTIRIPIDRSRPKEEAIEVQVNNRPYTIKKGVNVEVPEAVAEIIENSERTRNYAMQYIANAPNNDA